MILFNYGIRKIKNDNWEVMKYGKHWHIHVSSSLISAIIMCLTFNYRKNNKYNKRYNN